jgi:tetratricopeptide (TPR) repeat protein
MKLPRLRDVWLCAAHCSLAAGASACALLSGGAPRPLYTPAEHRAMLAELLPDLASDELIVPFEIDDAVVERAASIVRFAGSEKLRTLELVQALDREQRGFGLTYRWAQHNSAMDVMSAKGGTCMGLSSLLVGMLRSLGIKAYYAEAVEDPEMREEATVQVAAGHIAVEAVTDAGAFHIDFTGEIVRSGRYRRISDRLASAHYYNNRGYELIYEAEVAGTPVDWPRVREQFQRATRIEPRFAMGWNNYGVASVRLGELDRAAESYARAMALDPRLSSPQDNMERLRLAAGEGGVLTSRDGRLTAPSAGRREVESIVPKTVIPERGSPEPALPELSLPDLSLPDLSLPDTPLPDTSLPERIAPEVPEAALPEPAAPGPAAPGPAGQ